MIDVFIGYDEGEKVAFHILAESIRRNSSQPVSITPLCLSNIPDFTSILGPVYDHTKGNRKLKGRSPEARV